MLANLSFQFDMVMYNAMCNKTLVQLFVNNIIYKVYSTISSTYTPRITKAVWKKKRIVIASFHFTKTTKFSIIFLYYGSI